jgi:transposase
MSLKPQDIREIPENTEAVIQSWPRKKQGPYVILRDKLGPLFADDDFAPLYASPRGRPAEAPAVLALVLVLQFVEDLSDAAAAHQVVARVDWKYLLGLPLEDAGFDASVLTDFRARLAGRELVRLFLERVLTLAAEEGLLKKRGRQRTDSTHVIGAVRELNRLECVGRTMQGALNALAIVAPQWLQAWVPPEWYARYGQPFEYYLLPKSAAERRELAETIGQDGQQLLRQCEAPAAPGYLSGITAVMILGQIWAQQYELTAEQVRWRGNEELPPHAELICSPHEPEARYSTKRDTHWLGYKVHLTESCDAGYPRLITHVATTPSTTSDHAVLPDIQAELAAHGRLPAEHLVDTGYVDADTLVASAADYKVEVVGPVPPNTSWQAQVPGAYDLAQFIINWEAQVVLCPQGVTSSCWSETTHPDAPEGVIHVRFPRAVCQACPARAQCTRAQKDGRTLTFRPQAAHTALQARRREQTTTTFWERVKPRAGIEGTISQGVRAFGLRHARYRGLVKTHLQHLLTATAMNLVRLVAWWEEDLDARRQRRRIMPFLKLAPAPV